MHTLARMNQMVMKGAHFQLSEACRLQVATGSCLHYVEPVATFRSVSMHSGLVDFRMFDINMLILHHEGTCHGVLKREWLLI